MNAWKNAALVLASLAIFAAGCGKSEKAAPGQPWGERVGGLSCRLTSDNATLPMGAWVQARLEFDFDRKRAGGGADALNVDVGSRTVKFAFKRVGDGKAYERGPHDWGMDIGGCPGNMVEMGANKIPPDGSDIPMLSSEGEQIPPGEYLVSATYENEANATESYWDNGAGASRPFAHPERLWKGRLTSGSFKLTVLPATPAEVVLDLATSLTMEPGNENTQIVCNWSKENRRKVAVTVRPGYILGMSYVVFTSIAGGPEKQQGGEGVGSGSWCEGDVHWMGPEESRTVLAGAEMKARVAIALFETSAPGRHFWDPKSGDYKVLWTGDVKGVYQPKDAAK